MDKPIDPNDPIARLVLESTAATIAAREADAARRAAATLAASAKAPPIPRLRNAPAEAPHVEPPAPLASLAHLGWTRGVTRALDLADFILRMEGGWNIVVGADLWVWITLREANVFRTETLAVEDLLKTLCAAERKQTGKRFTYEPRGGRVNTLALPQDAPLDMQRWAQRCARDGLVFGPESALAWTIPAPWHYVVRSRASGGNITDELIGHGLTIAPTSAGAALVAWAEAYASDAEAALVPANHEEAPAPGTHEAPVAGTLPVPESRRYAGVLAEFMAAHDESPAAHHAAAPAPAPIDRFAGSRARLAERKALWRAYRNRMCAHASALWQVGF